MKYSTDWKKEQAARFGGWPQKHEPDRHGNRWRWHYIANETEMVDSRSFRLMRECVEANQR